MEEKKGCFLLFLLTIAFWAIVVVSCFDITSLVGVIVGLILSIFLLSCFKGIKRLLKIALILALGMCIAVLINFLLNTKMWVAITLPLIVMFALVVAISFFYEVKS